MTTLLTADTAAIFRHVFVNILVAHSGLDVVDTLLVERLVQAEVRHDGSDHSVGQQFATLLHVATVDIQDVVAGDDVTLLVHTQATVSIAVIGKTDVQTLLYNELLQTLDMGRASIVVDVQTVWLVVDDVGICAQCVEHALSNVPACTISAVQTDLDTLKGVDTEADQIAHVAVTTRNIVHGAADVLTVGKGQLRPVLIEHVQFAIDVILHQ